MKNRRSTGFDGISIVRKRDKCFVHPGNDVHDTAERIVDLVMFLIGHKNPKVRISTDLSSLKSIAYWKWSKHMWSMHVSDCHAEMTGEHVDFLMDELEIDQKCSIHIQHTGIGASPYTKGLKAQHLSISKGTWVHHDAILNSQSSEIRIYEASPPSMAQVNQYLKSWLSKSHLQNIKTLFFQCEQSLEWNETVALGGMETEQVATDTEWKIRREDGFVAHVFVNIRSFELCIRIRDYRKRSK